MQLLTKPLTEKQKEILDYIRNFYIHNGYSPILKEIAEKLGTSNISTAQYYLDQLIQKGYLTKNENKERGITPIVSPEPCPSVQLLGYIAAGSPIEPIENPLEINIPQNIKFDNKSSYYALKVKGDSMEDMNILNNDIVFIKHQLTAENGDVVVASTEKGVTLKVFRNKNGKIYLEPKNKNYQNIYPKELEIRGKMVGLTRSV